MNTFFSRLNRPLELEETFLPNKKVKLTSLYPAFLEGEPECGGDRCMLWKALRFKTSAGMGMKDFDEQVRTLCAGNGGSWEVFRQGSDMV